MLVKRRGVSRIRHVNESFPVVATDLHHGLLNHLVLDFLVKPGRRRDVAVAQKRGRDLLIDSGGGKTRAYGLAQIV